MIDVKQAVHKAIDYLREVSISEARDLRVEEVEKSEDGKHWLVTLGFRGDELVAGPTHRKFDTPSFGPMTFESRTITYPKYHREYRVFRVRGDDGAVEDMKIKSVNGDS